MTAEPMMSEIVEPIDWRARDERIGKLLTALNNGNSRRIAARFSGIDWPLLQRWMIEQPTLLAQIEEAEARAVVRNVQTVQKASEKHWQAAAWWLERRYPEDWGRIDRVDVYVRRQQAEALVDELRAEGISISLDDLLSEYDNASKRMLASARPGFDPQRSEG